jgi:phage baseplate assembly protein W
LKHWCYPSIIFVILATPTGSRIWQPDFGCNITKLLFSLETEDVLNEAKQEVRYALEKVGPRIRVLDVQVSLQR